MTQTQSEAFRRYQEQEKKRLEMNLALLEQGVQFIDLHNAYIDDTVQIGAGTVIGPCVILRGKTVIGKNCIIGQNSRIEDAVIADDVQIESAVILQSSVGQGTSIGPFAYLRPGSHVGSHCKVGDFVEVKNANLDDGAKAAHLTYIGDADVGKEVNLGCGVVFVNFDGRAKYRTVVGDHAFIGCNTNLVSPVRVGQGAYVAAGSTVTEDVSGDALYIARARGCEKPGWVSAKEMLKRTDK